ncbi:hypothetical protein [Pseudoduganella lutea]|uniref:PEP-CTERM sorting domain-containing protein n=1 Tax=Pseudoduganella lutea TaxID=321985 RepID=A0A4P6KRD2_9BURK|nr:hypothetical protein [Pseudoduganella lutea]QBE61609.1 hypothetical protein EWM63_00125 [Pseudoduganella lutea]
MKTIQLLLSCLLALLVPATALAEGRATARLEFSDGWLLQNGTPYMAPEPHDLWSQSSAIVVTRLREEQAFDFSTPSYGYWYARSCIGACANFPPDDTNVGPGGYAHGVTNGYMAMGGADPAVATTRADATATGPRINDASASGTYIIDLQPQVTSDFSVVFDVRPYLDLYIAPGSPAGSRAFAAVGVNVQFFDLTAGHSVLTVDRVFNHLLTAPEDDAGYIEDPGIVPFDIDLGLLHARSTYQLRIDQTTYAFVELAVPEPATGGLYIVGIAVLAAWARRCHRRPARRNG